MTAAPAFGDGLDRGEAEVGCVLGLDAGVLVVLTDAGAARASYGARMLRVLARDRSCTPEPGEWVVLRRWPDGPVTVEQTLRRTPAPGSHADVPGVVVPLHRGARRDRRTT